MINCNFFDDVLEDNAPIFLVRNVSDEGLFSMFSNHKLENVDPPIKKQQMEMPNFINYKRIRAQRQVNKKDNRKDYKKNICGYITKKIVRQFMSLTYHDKVLALCEKYGCDYDETISYYNRMIERITGPTHLDMLLNATKQNKGMKKCFKEFFLWFLRHRYLRYLLIQGKMEKKDAYVDYKNRVLLYLGSMEEELEYNLSSYGQLESRDTVTINSSVQ